MDRCPDFHTPAGPTGLTVRSTPALQLLAAGPTGRHGVSQQVPSYPLLFQELTNVQTPITLRGLTMGSSRTSERRRFPTSPLSARPFQRSSIRGTYQFRSSLHPPHTRSRTFVKVRTTLALFVQSGTIWRPRTWMRSGALARCLGTGAPSLIAHCDTLGPALTRWRSF